MPWTYNGEVVGLRGFDNLEFKDFRRQRISSQVVVIGPCGDLLGAYYDLKYVV